MVVVVVGVGGDAVKAHDKAVTLPGGRDAYLTEFSTYWFGRVR